MFTQTNRSILTGQLVSLIFLLGLASLASAQTIKIATLAPEGSGWMVDMRAGADEIKQLTEGRVKFKFYGGGVQGNDKQVLRKMRIGQLHGGAFTSTGVSAFEKDAQIYALPMVFNTLDEANYVRSRMDQGLRSKLEQAGYVNFGFAGGGFAVILSKQPVASLEDMQGLKIWVPDGDQMAYGAVKAMGVSPVTMPLTDVLTGLQTELIDTIMGPPAGVIVLQWNTAVEYITELPLAYIFAILIIEKKVFDRLQPADQLIVREVMEKIYQKFDDQGKAENLAAHQALLDDGIKSIEIDQQQHAKWQAAVRESNHKLAADGVISEQLLKQLECHVRAYRSGNTGNSCQ